MNNFVKSLRGLATKMKTYECSDIEIRTFENGDRTDLSIYTKETNHDYNLGEYKVAKRSTNIENENDFMDYCLVGLPGGRVAWGGYLYPRDLDSSKMKLYNFRDFWYRFFGEEVSDGRKFTIDELKGLLQIFRARIDMAKYQYLYEVKYRDDFDGVRKFKGSKYFAGCLDGDILKFEQINGQDNNIEMKKVGLDVSVMLGNETIDLATIYYYGHVENNEDVPFELIDVASTYNRGRIYDASYFTRDALSKIVEVRERETGIGNE